MRLLLDTHVLLWAVTDDPMLPAEAAKLILAPGHQVYYSIISLWETELKRIAHPKQLTVTAERLKAFCDMSGFTLSGLSEEAVFHLSALKRKKGAGMHKDPFDRMLVSHAIVKDLTILTHDKRIAEYRAVKVKLV